MWVLGACRAIFQHYSTTTLGGLIINFLVWIVKRRFLCSVFHVQTWPLLSLARKITSRFRTGTHSAIQLHVTKVVQNINSNNKRTTAATTTTIGCSYFNSKFIVFFNLGFSFVFKFAHIQIGVSKTGVQPGGAA